MTACSVCKHRLTLAGTHTCKCGSAFCAAHRLPEAHVCTYDHRGEGKKTLGVQLVASVPVKVEHI